MARKRHTTEKIIKHLKMLEIERANDRELLEFGTINVPDLRTAKALSS